MHVWECRVYGPNFMGHFLLKDYVTMSSLRRFSNLALVFLDLYPPRAPGVWHLLIPEIMGAPSHGFRRLTSQCSKNEELPTTRGPMIDSE